MVPRFESAPLHHLEDGFFLCNTRLAADEKMYMISVDEP